MKAFHLSRPRFVSYQSASPGFFVLDVLTDDSGCPSEPIKYPVVGWALEEETLAPYPITLEGVRTDNAYILQPDGSVERPNICGFANIEDWIADQIAAWRNRTGKAAQS